MVSEALIQLAVDQGLVAADRGIGTDLEVGPAQLVLDLFVALLDPVADRVEARDLSRAGCWVRAPDFAGTAGPGQVTLSGRVAGSAVTDTRRRAPSSPHQPTVALAARQVLACPSRKVRVTGCQSQRHDER